METEKLYSPLKFFFHDPQEKELAGDYGSHSIYDIRYRIHSVEALEFMDAIELAIRRDRDTMDKVRGMAEYLDGALGEKVTAMFPSIEPHGDELWCVTEVTLSETLTPTELAELKDWWSGQLSDGWGEGFEQREIAVEDCELYIVPWSSGEEFFIDTQREFDRRRGILGLMPEVAAMAEKDGDIYVAYKFDGFHGNTAFSLANCKQFASGPLTDGDTLDAIRARNSLPTTPGVLPPVDIEDVVIEPGVLININGIDPVELEEILDSGEKAEAFCARVLGGAETAEPIEELRSQLLERAQKNWDDYRHSPHPVTPDSIFHVSMAVVAHRDAEVLLKKYTDFSAEHLNCLLQFADPVDLIADYLSPDPDISELADILTSVMENQEELKEHYGLAETPLPDPDGKGYIFTVTDDHDSFYMPNILHVELDESLFKYPDDAAAALAAERDSIKLIHGMPYVPDGVYLDTQENRAAIADYFEQHRLSLPASEELIQDIRQRLDGNFADYKAGFENLTTRETFSEAAEIAAVCQSYDYFRNEHAYTTGQAEFLLKLQDPLELVSDRWSDMPLLIGDTVKGIFSDQERTLQNGGYILASDASAPAAKEPPRAENGAADKPSVLERIRRHQAVARKNPAPPKDTHRRKNHDQEH